MLLFVALSLTFTGLLSAAEPYEKFLGTWKEIPSAQSPVMMKIEPDGSGGIKFSQFCKQDGSCGITAIAKYDGKPCKASDDPNSAISFKKTEIRTVQRDLYFTGKVTGRGIWKVSSDGKTLTMINQAVASKGAKQVTASWDRSGGPVSAEDPFIGFWKRNLTKSDALTMTFRKQGGELVLTPSNGATQPKNCDGKDHPANFDIAGYTASCRFTDDRTEEMVSKQDGKVVGTGTDAISEDGKTMISVRRDAEGKTTVERTYEKVN